MTNRRSGMNWVSKLVLGLALGGSLIAVQPAAAQSTIFNIPSTDTVAPTKLYFEFDYVMQLPKPEEGQFSVFTPRLVLGVTPMLNQYCDCRPAHFGRFRKCSRRSSGYDFTTHTLRFTMSRCLRR